MQSRRLVLFVVLLALIPSHAMGQSTRRTVGGSVLAADGRKVAGANVFVLETLDGVVTGNDGRFLLSVSDTSITLVAHLESFDAGRLRVTMRDGTSLLASRVKSKELRHLAI